MSTSPLQLEVQAAHNPWNLWHIAQLTTAAPADNKRQQQSRKVVCCMPLRRGTYSCQLSTRHSAR